MTQAAVDIDREPAFANVLCGVDDSRPSAEAARQAALLAEHGGAVELVGVCWTVGEGRAKVSSLNVDRVRKALQDAHRAATHAGCEARWEIVRAENPARALIERAGGHDLIAVGSHAGSRVSGILLGSTASTLVHGAGVPVLVARRPPHPQAFPARILLASDGSPGSAVAARLAGRIARACAGDVTLAHVSDGDSPSMHGELARQSAELLEATGREPARTEASGDPPGEIVRLAADLGSGLIVIGSRGLGGLKALGSASERVAHRAPCSVLVARDGAAAAR